MAELFVSNTSLQLLALLGAGAVAGYVNVVAGGGSLLTVPLLIFLGLPETVANGTSRVAILTQSISATYASPMVVLAMPSGLGRREGCRSCAATAIGAVKAATKAVTTTLR